MKPPPKWWVRRILARGIYLALAERRRKLLAEIYGETISQEHQGS